MSMEMNYEEMEEIKEAEEAREAEEAKEAEEAEKAKEEKEAKETEEAEKAKKADDFPPKIVTKGETVEHRAARSELERDIAAGREIAAENSLRRLAEIEAREAAKK